MHFAGCSSSCAQHQIADVGIEGVLKKVDGEFVEAMDIRIGGRLGPEPRFGDVVVKKVPHWELNDTPAAHLHALREHHDEGETFRDFAAPDRARRGGPSSSRPVERWRDAGAPTSRRSTRGGAPGLGRASEYHPRLALACSFQKEASVLARPPPARSRRRRACSRSTPACCSRRPTRRGGGSRSATASRSRSTRGRRWRAGAAHGDALWAREPDACCDLRKVGPLARRARRRRRLDHRPAPRAVARRARRRRKLGWDAKHGLWKLNPLADWTERDVWRYIVEHDLPYHPLHDRGYASIGCTHCTRRGRPRGPLGGPREDRVRAARLSAVEPGSARTAVAAPASCSSPRRST